MFVDKTLVGVNAVQTLSPLNRIAPGKNDTLVLDFRDREANQDEFQRFYAETTALPAEINSLSDALDTVLRDYDVIDLDDVTDACFALDPAKRNQATIYAALKPAQQRYGKLLEEDKEGFKHAGEKFVRMYAFLSQVFPDNDPETERLYVYVRALLQVLLDGKSGRLQLGDQVVLTHLAIEEGEGGAIDIADEPADPLSPFPGGRSRRPGREEVGDPRRHHRPHQQGARAEPRPPASAGARAGVPDLDPR